MSDSVAGRMPIWTARHTANDGQLAEARRRLDTQRQLDRRQLDHADDERHDGAGHDRHHQRLQ